MLKNLIKTHLKKDLKEKEKILTPLLFSCTILILFKFIHEDLGESSNAEQQKLVLGQMYLTCLIAMQSYLVHIFQSEEQDKCLDYLKASPAPLPTWYLSKLIPTFLMSGIIFATIYLLNLFFFPRVDLLSQCFGLLSIGALSLLGLCALGTLLSAITITANGKELLFPLLYFPLAIPVLLSSLQGSISLFNSESDALFQWVALLVGFDVIYLTLAILLIEEVIYD